MPRFTSTVQRAFWMARDRRCTPHRRGAAIASRGGLVLLRPTCGRIAHARAERICGVRGAHAPLEELKRPLLLHADGMPCRVVAVAMAPGGLYTADIITATFPTRHGAAFLARASPLATCLPSDEPSAASRWAWTMRSKYTHPARIKRFFLSPSTRAPQGAAWLCGCHLSRLRRRLCAGSASARRVSRHAVAGVAHDMVPR